MELRGRSVCIIGVFQEEDDIETLRRWVKSLGGRLAKKVDRNTDLVITSHPYDILISMGRKSVMKRIFASAVFSIVIGALTGIMVGDDLKKDDIHLLVRAFKKEYRKAEKYGVQTVTVEEFEELVR